MRFQIDEQRERLKEKIDDIALALTDKIKKHEVMYLNSLKEHFTSFDHNKSLEIEFIFKAEREKKHMKYISQEFESR
jgi:hypothetical protein